MVSRIIEKAKAEVSQMNEYYKYSIFALSEYTTAKQSIDANDRFQEKHPNIIKDKIRRPLSESMVEAARQDYIAITRQLVDTVNYTILEFAITFSRAKVLESVHIRKVPTSEYLKNQYYKDELIEYCKRYSNIYKEIIQPLCTDVEPSTLLHDTKVLIDNYIDISQKQWGKNHEHYLMKKLTYNPNVQIELLGLVYIANDIVIVNEKNTRLQSFYAMYLQTGNDRGYITKKLSISETTYYVYQLKYLQSMSSILWGIGAREELKTLKTNKGA